MASRFVVHPILLVCLAATNALSQVHSLTLGIDVNSPYGIGEPWATIREGLLRLDFVESASAQPDRGANTGELRPRGGQLPDLEVLARALLNIGAGASLRGVEGTIDGQLAKDGADFVLRITGSDTVVHLNPLTKLVQRNQKATDTERNAYQALTTRWKDQPIPVRVVGPLVQRAAGKDAAKGRPFTFEVRKFELR